MRSHRPIVFLVTLSLTLLAVGGCQRVERSSGSEEVVTDVSIPEDFSVFEPPSNPIVSTQFFGRDGNLYKPVSDPDASGGGNMVVLLSSQFTEQFDSCEIPVRSGRKAQLTCINDQPWTQIPFSCFSNGNRQTWRASFGCSEVAEITVTCYQFNQEVVFTLPDESKFRVCTRFG